MKNYQQDRGLHQAANSRDNIEYSLALAGASQAVFTRLYPQAARAAADHADALAQAGVQAPPLSGLPVSIKDLFDVAGETTLAGSAVLRDSAPATADATVVTRLRAAGAAIIGKTNMTEFAFSGLGLNPHHGTPANPADGKLARIPGGSSSGAAVSVAMGACFAGIGSDTGGSIRIPAALCGLVGFKSTARRVSTAGALPLSTTLDTACAMTKSVADCILVDGVLAGAALEVPRLPLAGLRLALPQTLVLDGMDAKVGAALQAALSRLSAAGAKIVELPLELLAQAAVLNRFSPAEAWAWHRQLLGEKEAQYDPRVSARIKLGAAITAADYIDMLAARRDWIARAESELAEFDAIVLPTTPLVAPAIASLQDSDEEYFRVNALMLRNPALINFLDGCAISLPCQAAGELPVGLMLAAPAMQDARLLGIALAVEAALKQATA